MDYSSHLRQGVSRHGAMLQARRDADGVRKIPVHPVYDAEISVYRKNAEMYSEKCLYTKNTISKQCECQKWALCNCFHTWLCRIGMGKMQVAIVFMLDKEKVLQL